MVTPSAIDIARQHQADETRLAGLVLAAVRQLWRQVSFADLDATFGAVAPRMALSVAAGQLAAAQVAESYVDAALLAQGLDPANVATLVPRAFAGVTSTGRDVVSMLTSSIVQTKVAIGAGAPMAEAMSVGEGFLSMAIPTEIADAGRSAVGTAMATRHVVTGYVRQVSPGACSRCILLAGRHYRWNAGFSRHPHCYCVHIPTSEDVEDDPSTDPDAHFRSLSAEEQNRTFGKAGAQALRDGADMSQVVNARSGMFTTAEGRKGTTSGTTSRGLAGQRLQGAPRMMPEAIYGRAGSREEALNLLRAHGYIR